MVYIPGYSLPECVYQGVYHGVYPPWVCISVVYPGIASLGVYNLGIPQGMPPWVCITVGTQGMPPCVYNCGVPQGMPPCVYNRVYLRVCLPVCVYNRVYLRVCLPGCAPSIPVSLLVDSSSLFYSRFTVGLVLPPPGRLSYSRFPVGR